MSISMSRAALRINEPAADLAVAAALVSSLTGRSLPPRCVFFGEIGLSGAIRPVAHAMARLEGSREAWLYACHRTALAQEPGEAMAAMAENMVIKSCAEVADLVAFIAAPERNATARKRRPLG